MSPSKLFGFSKTQGDHVSVVRDLSRTARTRAACVSLSFFNDVKEPGEFLNPPTFSSGRDLMPGPLARVTGLDRQLHQDASRGVCAVEQRAPLSDGRYMRRRLWVSSGFVAIFLQFTQRLETSVHFRSTKQPFSACHFAASRHQTAWNTPCADPCGAHA